MLSAHGLARRRAGRSLSPAWGQKASCVPVSQTPFWVNRVGLAIRDKLPGRSDQRTYSRAAATEGMGHKRTLHLNVVQLPLNERSEQIEAATVGGHFHGCCQFFPHAQIADVPKFLRWAEVEKT